MIPMFLFLPYLIAALIALFQSAITFFLKFMTRKFAAIASATAIFVGLTAALIIALNVIIAGITYTMPNEITMAISWIMPSNTTACVSAYYSAVSVKFVYDLKSKVVRTTFHM